MRALPILGVAAALVAVAPSASGETAAPHRAGARVAHVDYAVDGDTLRVELADGELTYVRLVGMLSRVSRPTLRLPVVASG